MLYSSSSENIRKAAALIQAGALVAFPTETVYGLGADARNPQAVEKIYQAKGRPSNNPLIVHLAEFEQIYEVAEVSPGSEIDHQIHILKEFWPGPLTLVLPKKPWVPNLVTAGLASVAIRIPKHPVALDLIRQAGCPIAAPSANRSGYISPTCAEHVQAGLGDRIEMILDGGYCQVGLESTIVSLVQQPACLLRSGAITLEQLTDKLGKVQQPQTQKLDQSAPLLAPGMMSSHYAPRTPLRFITNQKPQDLPKRYGLIRFNQTQASALEIDSSHTSLLSKEGKLEEIAQNIFAAMREQDSLGLELILVDVCPEQGLGLAIMDRLKRACA